MHFAKITSLFAFALATGALALPNPIAEPEPAPLPAAIEKRCHSCTKPKGSVCHSGCHTVSPTQIVKACGALGIDIGASAGLTGILQGAVAAHAGVDVDIGAAVKVDAGVKGQWESICKHIGVPSTGVVIAGSLNVGVGLSVGAGLGGFLGGLWGGGGHCGACEGW